MEQHVKRHRQTARVAAAREGAKRQLRASKSTSPRGKILYADAAWLGALVPDFEKLGRWKAIIGFPVSSPSALITRTAPSPKLCPNVALINTTQHQALRPGPPQALVESIQKVSTTCGPRRRRRRREVEFFHYKNDLKRHAHTPSGVAGAGGGEKLNRT